FAVDLGQLGIAVRVVIAVHHEPVLRLVRGVEQALLVDGYAVGGVLRRQRHDAKRKRRRACQCGSGNFHGRFSPVVHLLPFSPRFSGWGAAYGKSLAAMAWPDNGMRL